MKKVLYIILATLAAGYIIAAGVIFTGNSDRRLAAVCKEVEVIVTDSLEKQFIRSKDVINHLIRMGLYPMNKKMANINTHDIEIAVMKNEIIEKTEVIQTVSGKIRIVVSQKKPVLRIISTEGSYYVDQSGRTMPIVLGQAIYVPVASGNIERSFATSDLYTFSLFLQRNDFWNDMITQIHVHSRSDIEIIPRVGHHHILIGDLYDYEDKLRRLRLFYEQVIPKMGWDRYSAVNLRYRNQIVCTKIKNTEQ